MSATFLCFCLLGRLDIICQKLPAGSLTRTHAHTHTHAHTRTHARTHTYGQAGGLNAGFSDTSQVLGGLFWVIGVGGGGVIVH